MFILEPHILQAFAILSKQIFSKLRNFYWVHNDWYYIVLTRRRLLSSTGEILHRVSSAKP